MKVLLFVWNVYVFYSLSFSAADIKTSFFLCIGCGSSSTIIDADENNIDQLAKAIPNWAKPFLYLSSDTIPYVYVYIYIYKHRVICEYVCIVSIILPMCINRSNFTELEADTWLALNHMRVTSESQLKKSVTTFAAT